MTNFLSDYFAMVRRETSFPSWAGGRSHDSYASDDEPTSPAMKAAHSKVTELGYPGDEHPYSPEFNGGQSSSDFNSDFSPKKQEKGILWPVIATGAGLFSDGYINNTTGFAITILKRIYPSELLTKSDALTNLGAITFVGTVVGMLAFGLIADYWSRKAGMLISTGILIIFSILAAGSWGSGMPENPVGMLDMLITMRALVGVGIGGEYPAGSVACAEVSQKLTKGTRNRYFILFTDFMIDCGFVISAFVCWLMMYICDVPDYAHPGMSHGLQTAWRVLMGLGAIPPLSLLYLRLKFKDSEQFTKNSLKKVKKTPWWLIIRRYFPRLCLVSIIWFIYDFSGYSFGTYSSTIISSQVPTRLIDGTKISNIKTSFGWTIVFNVFYLPGSFLGAFSSDYFGPRLTLFVGLVLQGVVGFIMGAEYDQLTKNIAGLVVAYGIFSTLGEFGPGDNIGLICSKTSASAVRGRYYAIAAAIGKVGAFVGNYAFPSIAKHYGGIDSSHGQQVLVYISSALCIFAAVLTIFIPEISQEAIAMEDIAFRNLLLENGIHPSELDPTLAGGALDELPPGTTARA